jgi:hypothetical protein
MSWRIVRFSPSSLGIRAFWKNRPESRVRVTEDFRLKRKMTGEPDESYCSLAYSALACFRMGMSLGITNQHYVTAVSTPAHEKALAIGGQREIVDRFVMEMGDLCRGASFDWLAPQVRETGVGLVE